jgi:hypothetical protein
MMSSVDGRIKQNNWPIKNPGRMEVPTVFDVEAGYTRRKAARLKLRSAKIVNQDFVMLQYTLSK